MESKNLFLVDAFAMIYRAYYAFINNPRITTTGINTSATFGFCTFITELLEEQKPTHIAVVFDPEGPTFRHEMYSPYKAQRPPMPEDIRSAIPYIKQIIQNLGIKHISVPGYEADDVIGTLAKRAENEGFHVYMITPDKDYAQLVTPNITMYKPSRSGNLSETWDIPEVLDKFGIERIDQVIDILGLMGDTADNVPGCSGVGPKTAASLVYKYGDIEGIYEHIDELKGKQKERLLECRDTVMLSKKLVTICTQVPTDIAIENLRRESVEVNELKEVLQKLEIFSLVNRLVNSGKRLEDADDLQHEEDLHLTINNCSNIAEVIERVSTQNSFALTFIEPDNFNLYSDWPKGVIISAQDNSVEVIKLCCSPQQELLALKPLFENSEKCWITDKTKHNLIILKRLGIDIKCKIFDITIAHYILQPELSHSLQRMALELLHYQFTEKQTTIQPTQLSLFDEVIEEDFSRPATECNLIFRLKPILQRKLEESNFTNLFYNVEMPLCFVLADMEFEGVAVDINALHTLATEFKEKCNSLEKQIYAEAGHEFNINSPKQLGDVLFGELQLDPQQKKTKTGQFVTSEQVLSKLEEANSIVKHILEYRGIKKLLSTYADALPEYINKADGKIHTNFNQTETATGRLSSLNPNLQNIPIRTEEGRKIRKAFIPGNSDYSFFSADYSQVELRLMASLSKDPEMIAAFKNGEDIHSATASKIYKTPIDQVTSEMRRRAKTANFGIIYGISAWGLAERLNISRKEGKELIDGYFEMYPEVKKYMENSIDHARKKRYVETILGRRRYLNDINSHNAVVRGVAERNAVNAPIQGSAADIIKMAMICIWRELNERGLKSKMIIQVHDELNFKCHNSEKELLKEIVVSCMEKIVNLSVPLTVSCGFGKNWYEAH